MPGNSYKKKRAHPKINRQNSKTTFIVKINDWAFMIISIFLTFNDKQNIISFTPKISLKVEQMKKVEQ